MSIPVSEATQPVDGMSRPTNLKEAWEQYKAHLQSTLPSNKASAEIRSTQTALFRYTVPGWGGPVPLSERLSPSEIEQAIQFAESVSLVQVQAIDSTMESVIQQLETDYSSQQMEPDKDWKKYFQGLRKRNKHYVNKFWDWINEKGWFEPLAEPKLPSKSYRFNRGVKGKTPLQEVRQTQRKQTSRDEAGLAQSDKSKVREDIFALGKVKGEQINPELQGQLDALYAFMTDGRMGEAPLRACSAEAHIKGVLQILGYFHRILGVPLADLRLETLVPFVKLSFSAEDLTSIEQWIIQSWKARTRAKEQATEMELKVREFMAWRDSRLSGNPPLHPRSHQKSINAWTVVAKYIYRLETDQDETDDFEDISAVRRLRKLNRELVKRAKNTRNVINHTQKMVPWPALLAAVERLRVEAELDRISSGHKRTRSAQAKSMRRFLILGFMTIMPPDRQRTYRELREGRTLVKGRYDEDKDEFIPSGRLPDPQTATWYIHLEPPDYKTGDTYGEWWGEVPNVVYPDGKTFYGYMEEWLTQWRPVFVPNHDYFFTQTNGEPMGQGAVTTLVKRALYRLLDVPVTPHILRNMFVTYLSDQEVPDHVHESAALAMHHSRRIAKKYNKKKQSEQLRSSFSLARELVQQAWEVRLPLAQTQASAAECKVI